MSNIFENNNNKIDLKLSLSEYWDLTLSKDVDPSTLLDDTTYYDSNLISFIDINDNSCIGVNKIYGSGNYKWSSSINKGLELKNIGFTGIDNGLILFDKKTITSNELLQLITDSSHVIDVGDMRLTLNAISGNTGEYIYPTTLVETEDGNSIRFNGGFYQGVYKSKEEYQILPNIINDEITFNFTIKPDFITFPLMNTLNYKYPDNKGFFFYMGLRAENKFWYGYNKDLEENFEIKSINNEIILETGITITTDDNFNINQQGIYEILTDNKFLLLNRGKNGLNTKTFNESKQYSISDIEKHNPNLYLLLNRTLAGNTVNNIEELPEKKLKAKIINDIVNNQIGFRVKDDGSIGYRTIIYSCDEEFDVVEEYSNPKMINDNEWSSISIRMIMNNYSVCGDANRTYILQFYINGKLIFISKNLPELLFRSLDERDQKQELVPFNLSIGGGTQGLSNLIGFDNNYSTQYLLPIEKYFSGSFIGEISKFRIFNGKHDYSKIKNNYNYEFNVTTSDKYIEPTIDMTLNSNSITYPETIYRREKGNTDTLINAYIKLNKYINELVKPLTGYKLYYYVDNSPRIQINNLFQINPLGGAISEFNHTNESLKLQNLQSIKYMIEIFDTHRNLNGTTQIKEIKFDNMIFYGSTENVPSTTNEIRGLSGRIFNEDAKVINLQTGSNNSVFVLAIPESRNIISVFDINAMNIELTNSYHVIDMNIEDAGGFETAYNVYIMKNAIPYYKNHNHVITLNNKEINNI